MSNKKTKLIKSTGNAAAVSRGKHLTRFHQAYASAFQLGEPCYYISRRTR